MLLVIVSERGTGRRSIGDKVIGTGRPSLNPTPTCLRCNPHKEFRYFKRIVLWPKKPCCRRSFAYVTLFVPVEQTDSLHLLIRRNTLVQPIERALDYAIPEILLYELADRCESLPRGRRCSSRQRPF